MKAQSAREEEGYLVQSILHAAQVLRAFESIGDRLRLRDVVERTGLGKGLCFRLLRTLRHCGWLEKVDERHYRRVRDLNRGKRYRIGYAAQGQDSSFPREVLGSIQRAAEPRDVELIVVSNRYQPKVALRNAKILAHEGIDLVIEFQTDEAVAPAIASTYREAEIPMIAIDIPHPGATYFGADNYRAGLLAGRYLGRWAKSHWEGHVDEILLLELKRAGSLIHARISGALAGMHEVLRETDPNPPAVMLDGDGQFRTSLDKVRRYLRTSKAERVLVAAANDPSALGVARAFQESGRGDGCVIVGQNGEPDARAELREKRTPLIGTVGFFPENYGEPLLKLALDILARKQTPPAMFIRHQVITAENVDHFYPNDALLRLVPPASMG